MKSSSQNFNCKFVPVQHHQQTKLPINRNTLKMKSNRVRFAPACQVIVLVNRTNLLDECCAGGTGLATSSKEMRRRRGLISDAVGHIAHDNII
jgi:hypothetical protein